MHRASFWQVVEILAGVGGKDDWVQSKIRQPPRPIDISTNCSNTMFLEEVEVLKKGLDAVALLVLPSMNASYFLLYL